MRLLAKLGTLIAVAGVLFAGHANAQTTPTLDAAMAAALNNALATGDVAAVEQVVASNQGNAAATQAIAAIILAAAQSIKSTDPGGAGILAAIAVTSGGLQGSAAITATNLVNVSGNAIANAVVALANAGVPEPVIAAAVLIGVTVSPASNPSQVACRGSCN